MQDGNMARNIISAEQKFISIGEYMFLVAYAAYFSTLVLAISVLESNDTALLVFKIVRYISYVLVFIKICTDQFYDKQIGLLVVAVFLICVSAYLSSHTSLIIIFLFLIGARNVEIRKIIKISAIIQAVIMIIIISLSQIGILLDYVIFSGDRWRHCLGFEWANTAPYLFFFFTLEYLYLRKKRLRFYEIVIFAAIHYGFYIMTGTRFAFALGVIVLICFWLLKFYCQNHEDYTPKNKWLIAFPEIVCVGAILIHYFYHAGNDIWERLNLMFSGRLALGKAALDEYGVSIFGTFVRWRGNGIIGKDSDEYNFVDSSYVKSLIEYGLVILCIIIAIYTLIMWYAIKERNFYLQLAMFFILLVCFTEPFIFRLADNPFVFFIAEVFAVKKGERAASPVLIANTKIRFNVPEIGIKDRK